MIPLELSKNARFCYTPPLSCCILSQISARAGANGHQAAYLGMEGQAEFGMDR
jgi:hypothetical protein